MRCRPVFCIGAVVVQAPSNQQQRRRFVHMHDACDLLNLLALQLEHGTPLSQRIFRVLQESHCDRQHMAPTEKFQARGATYGTLRGGPIK